MLLILARNAHPGVNSRLCLTKPWIPFFFVQWLSWSSPINELYSRPSYMERYIFSGTFGLLLSSLKPSQCLFITGNCIRKASRSARSFPSNCTMPAVRRGPLGLGPGPCDPVKVRRRTGQQGSPLSACCLRLLWDVPAQSSGRWDSGEGLGTSSHVAPSLHCNGAGWWWGDWRGRSGKDFPLHKENEKGNRGPVASCQAPRMHQPWELAPGQPPQRLLTWENRPPGHCQECRQWSFGYFTFES